MARFPSRNTCLIDLGKGVSEHLIKNLKLESNDVIGIKLNIPFELIYSLGLKVGNKNLKKVKQLILGNGYIITDIVAVYPNLTRPRYILPFNDKHSHRFLFGNLFMPRRYSLNILNRIALRVYYWLLNVMSNPSKIHQYCYLFVHKNEESN